MLDLRIERPEQPLEIGREYLSKVTEGWDNPTIGKGCWQVYTEISGYNGAGGYWVKEHWRWSTGGTHHTEIRTLSHEQSRQLEREVQLLAAA